MIIKHTKIVTILVLALFLLPKATKAQTNTLPAFHLVNVPTNLTVDQEIIIGVMIENVPEIYGADIRLSFDADVMEVVDSDTNLDGIQLVTGDFLDPEQGFELQHAVNNKTGSIDYAISLLNPAPPAQGKGLLIEITFRAKMDGQATISIEEGLLGTQTGETISPILDKTRINITSNFGNKVIESDESLLGKNSPEENSFDEIESDKIQSVIHVLDNKEGISSNLIILGILAVFIVGIFAGKLLARNHS